MMRYISILVFIFFLGCKNDVERSLPGQYELESDPDSPVVKRKLILDLKGNGSYSITKSGREVVTGEWSAGDNGDFSWVSLTKGASYGSDGMVEGLDRESIVVFNPLMLGIKSNKELIFIRVK